MSDDLSLFKEWPKLARLKTVGITISEKIDGTNACVVVPPEGPLLFQSRTRFIVPGDDNCGFAQWATENEAALRKLGEGRHFGEWWGKGIQKHPAPFKRFSIFNCMRPPSTVPDGIFQVPILYQGILNGTVIQECMDKLREGGSVAYPGNFSPEGIVVHFHGVGLYKKTFRDEPKSSYKKEDTNVTTQ